MRTIVLVVLLAGLCACAAALPFIAAAIPIAERAERALDWIVQVERHVAPTLDAVDKPTADAVRTAIPKARAAAVAVRDCGRAAQDTGGVIDCARALDDLQRELEALFGAARPLGVQQVDEPGLLGAPPDGVGVLGVPSACAIVRGAAACGASAAPGGGAR